MASYEDSVAESVGVSTLNALSAVVSGDISDVLSAYGDIGTLCQAVTSMAMDDVVLEIGRLRMETGDDVSLSDVCVSVVTLYATAQESISTDDILSLAIAIRPLVESLLTSTVASSAGSTFHSEITQGIELNTKTLLSFYASIAESINTTGSIQQFVNKICTCAEKIGVSGSIDTLIKAMCPLVVSVLLGEALSNGKGVSVAESVATDDSAIQRVHAFVEKIEQAVISESLTGQSVVSIAVENTVAVDDELTGKSIIYNLIQDGVKFQISFDNDGYQWTGWCMNADNFGVSSYGEYPFNSFAKVGGKYYGANANGLYLLEGDSDDGEAISAKVLLASTDFDDPKKGTIRDAWLGLRSDGEVFFKLVTDDNKERWYKANAANTHLDRTRVKLARGLRSNYWQVGLENIDGADFELSNIELVHVVLSRH